MRKHLLPILLTFILFSNTSFTQSPLDSLAIEVSGTSREFSFTNKETAFYDGETNAANSSSWQGFNVFGHEFVDDYEILVNDKMLDRTSAIRAVVYPDFLRRYYQDGIVEELRLADSIALFSVTIIAPEPVHVDIVPYFSDGHSREDYEVQLKHEIALVARTNHLARTDKDNYPAWLAIHGRGFLPQMKSSKKPGEFSPVMMLARTATSQTIAFCVGDNAEAAESTVREYILHKEKYDAARRARMEKLLSETAVETADRRFDKALAWAKLSLDALMMNQVTKGIFAGLPWFNNYWGRDTFISLPGATLVQGRFPEAAQILKSFAAFQQLDSNSTDYGRIPNIVTTTDKAYNTADGTPRFVMMAKEYVERSGDTTFLYGIYPTVLRAIEGTLKYHCDSLGFLTHGDAETWMDAVGPDGPWSPRGNRANDIQALWAQQLEAGIWFATLIGDVISAQRWDSQMRMLKKNFPVHFIRKGVVTDHLNKDGTADKQLRPNQIFTSSLLDDALRASVLRSVTRNLTYPYGVASLSQNDANFHPYHQYEPYYPKDAAYHNGTVWTWLQGAVISGLCYFERQEVAAEITGNTVHQILDRGAVGTQSELIDAIARPGETEPRLSGTFSQAWNLAEFIRNFYDDYLGIKVSLLKHHLVLQPHAPASFGSIKATVNLNGRTLPIQILRAADSTVVVIDGKNLRKGGTAEISFTSKEQYRMHTLFKIPPQSNTRYILRDTSVTLYMNDLRQTDFSTSLTKLNQPRSLNSLTLATPKLTKDLRALKGPDYWLLSHSQIRSANPSAKVVADLDDPVGDDVGTGAYTYPGNPQFVKGSFDLTHFKVTSDTRNAYFTLRFKALSNPGWHPEYGFQLTYVAIAIDEDGLANSGNRMVGQNAHFVLDEHHGYERLILVGGGVRVEDKTGKILAGYIPAESDISNPLGNTETGAISFALPLSCLGKPSNTWTFTVLTGAQDDHGGAGLGEFRNVNKEAGEWNGGGKQNPDDPNVFDVLVAGK